MAFRCAASCLPSQKKARELGIPFEALQPDTLEEAIYRANELLYRIVDTCASNEYRVFLSGGGNFRKLLYPQYKAHRDDKPKPPYLDSLRELLVREWEAELCSGYEADDGIGMAHSEHAIIVSNDKDFKQIPGEHYNPVKDEFEVVDSIEASRYFYTQMLKGDSSDNVPGIDGIGDVRAGRLLRDKSPEEMHSIVYDLYGDPKRFFLNHRLLSILRSAQEWEELQAELNETTVSKSEGQELTEESA